jgi:hypothetical protein
MAPENAPPSAGSAAASAATRCAAPGPTRREANHAAPANGRSPPNPDVQSDDGLSATTTLSNDTKPIGVVGTPDPVTTPS